MVLLCLLQCLVIEPTGRKYSSWGTTFEKKSKGWRREDFHPRRSLLTLQRPSGTRVPENVCAFVKILNSFPHEWMGMLDHAPNARSPAVCVTGSSKCWPYLCKAELLGGRAYGENAERALKRPSCPWPLPLCLFASKCRTGAVSFISCPTIELCGASDLGSRSSWPLEHSTLNFYSFFLSPPPFF